MNSRLGKTKIQNEISLLDNDTTITNKSIISKIFADYFSTSPKQKLDEHFNKLPLECTISESVNRTFFFQPVSPKEVADVINDMKNKTCRGFDDIPIKLLKFSKEIIHLRTLFIYR